MLLSGIFLFSFSAYDRWAADSPSILRYAFLILGLIFLFVSIKPKNWKGWVYFTADDYGVHFSSPLSQGKEQTFLDVKWDNVGNIKSEALYGGVNGISIELKVSQIDVDLYFSETARANKILGFNQMRGDFFVVAYSNNAFQKIPNVVLRLKEIKTKKLP
jgi:hypothetical protein